MATVGPYQLLERVGRGGTAEVFRALDTRNNATVALKVVNRALAEDVTFRQRFEQEMRLMKMLNHPAIVPLLDVGEARGRPYLVMPYIDNGSLVQRMQQGPLSLEETTRIVSRIAPALDLAHSRGIVHRDLKPANILLDHDNAPYLTDFGIAKLLGTAPHLTINQNGETMGTPAYMSPEQCRGIKDIDGRADVYALGVLVFQMLTGTLPFDAETSHAILYQHIEAPIPDIRTRRDNLPNDLHIVMQRALAKNPDDRYATTRTFALDLQRIVAGTSVAPIFTNEMAESVAASITANDPTKRPTNRALRWLLPVALLAVVLILVSLMPRAFAALNTANNPTPLPLVSDSTPTPTPTNTVVATETEVGSPTRTATTTATETATRAPTRTPTETPLPPSATAVPAFTGTASPTPEPSSTPQPTRPPTAPQPTIFVTWTPSIVPSTFTPIVVASATPVPPPAASATPAPPPPPSPTESNGGGNDDPTPEPEPEPTTPPPPTPVPPTPLPPPTNPTNTPLPPPEEPTPLPTPES